MKRILMMIVLVCTVAVANAQLKTLQELVGVWEAIDQQNDRGSLEFKDTTQLYITFMGQRKPAQSFTVNLNKTPHEFNMAIQEDNETINLKGRLHFVNKDNIKWEVFVPGDAGGGPQSEIVLLRRRK